MSEVSMTHDANRELHHDAAGWALGALDPDDAAAFEVHLATLHECQSAVAEFESMARALRSPAPAVEPPPDLEAKVLASVQHAVMTAREAGQAGDTSRTAVMRKPSQGAQTTVLDLHTARARLRTAHPGQHRRKCPGGGTGTPRCCR